VQRGKVFGRERRGGGEMRVLGTDFEDEEEGSRWKEDRLVLRTE